MARLELVGASAFPRHWIYDADGVLAGKSALIDFKTWYRTAGLARSPWRGLENEVVATEAETALERRLSLIIMREGGRAPRVVSYLAADLSVEDLRELATDHHREDQQE